MSLASEHTEYNEWTSRIARNDTEAMRLLYEHFFRDLYRFTIQLVKSETLAEDVVHDTFVKVWENRHQLNQQLSLKSYLFTICRNQAFNLLQKAATQSRLQEEIIYHYTAVFGQEEDQEVLEQQAETLQNALQSLPPQRRQIFTMAKIEGASYEQIAAQLGISKGTISDHIVKANRFLKEFFKKNQNRA